MRYWLMKSEPDVYSIDDLARDTRTSWEGVRNYTARNWMRDDMKVGDRVLYYHSNAEPSGVAGIAEVVRAAYADPHALDPASPYHDPGAKADTPRWVSVDIGFVERFPAVVPLAALKAEPALVGMEVTKRGSRLSVHPVDAAHFEKVVAMGRNAGPSGDDQA
ncbi:MAG: EVE domain-containing protein [Pseudomonadota bacterium]|nr:EVE domain-containing protein [Pseudomonadota bacterium]